MNNPKLFKAKSRPPTIKYEYNCSINKILVKTSVWDLCPIDPNPDNNYKKNRIRIIIRIRLFPDLRAIAIARAGAVSDQGFNNTNPDQERQKKSNLPEYGTLLKKQIIV